MLVALVEFWNGLEPAGQAALVGVIASAVVALLQKAWPGLAIVPNQVKRALIALMAGLSAFVATGDLGGAVAAALSAFGTYHLATAEGK
jgi:hypothetical protein